MASSKGHEYFLKHYLGTHHNDIAEDMAKDTVKEIVWHEQAPQGKMDLVVDLNFRMDTSALYSDIVLARGDVVREGRSEFDRHAQFHSPALGGRAAVLGVQERLADLPRDRARSSPSSPPSTSPSRCGISSPRRWHHDTPAEIAQPKLQDWKKGEVEADSRQDDARTSSVVQRDYTNLYNQFISFGPLVSKNGLGAHGTQVHGRRRVRRVPEELADAELGWARPFSRSSRTSRSAIRFCISRR